MRPDDTYNDNADNFSQVVGEKLREHKLPVDPAVWQALERRLPESRRKKPVLWPWLSAGAVAVVVALFFILNPFVGPIPSVDNQLPSETHADAIPSVEEIALEESDKSLVVDAKSKFKSNNRKEPIESIKMDEFASSSKKALQVERVEHRKILLSAHVPNPDEIARTIKISKKENSFSLENNTEEGGLFESSPSRLSVLADLSENTVGKDLVEEKPKGLQSFIAAVGGGGLPIDFSLGGYSNDNLQFNDHFLGGEYNNGIGSGPVDGYEILKPGDYTDVEHQLPVTFSLTADIPIARNLSFETGLSYTYLFSRFSRKDQSVYRGTLRQHYIGLPMNIRYHFWRSDTWSIYMQGGASIEKGVRSVYRQRVEREGRVVTHSRLQSGINGFQLSAQGGVGFSYRLQDNLSLFGEPRLIYYFNNNQPLSARTENPLIFGLNLGVRLQFK